MVKYPSRDLQHIIITPKYRRAIFSAEAVHNSLEGLIRHICAFHDIEIKALAIQPDHVHLMVVLPLKTKMSIPYAMQQIKWFTSRNLKRQFAHLRREQAVWGVHYWQKSVGGGAATQKKYIDDQMRKFN